jgi:hypothetical protein
MQCSRNGRATFYHIQLLCQPKPFFSQNADSITYLCKKIRASRLAPRAIAEAMTRLCTQVRNTKTSMLAGMSQPAAGRKILSECYQHLGHCRGCQISQCCSRVHDQELLSPHICAKCHNSFQERHLKPTTRVAAIRKISPLRFYGDVCPRP